MLRRRSSKKKAGDAAIPEDTANADDADGNGNGKDDAADSTMASRIGAAGAAAISAAVAFFGLLHYRRGLKRESTVTVCLVEDCYCSVSRCVRLGSVICLI